MQNATRSPDPHRGDGAETTPPSPKLAPARRGFSVLSLGDWLDAATAAGAATVPATKVAVFEAADLQNFDREGPHIARLAAAYDDVEKGRIEVEKNLLDRDGPGAVMVRWDLCSSLDVKGAMNRGERPAPRVLHALPCDDPRFFDFLTTDWPRLEMPVFARPWIEPARLRGYPAEYRVFAYGGRARAVSAYYPQRKAPGRDYDRNRDLRWAEESLAAAERVMAEVRKSLVADGGEGRQSKPPGWGEASEQIVRTMNDQFSRPPADCVSASLDFIVPADGGTPLFLEGGPGAGSGAHPCCFASAEAIEDALDSLEDPDEPLIRLEPEGPESK